jgi:hypothetical protein
MPLYSFTSRDGETIEVEYPLHAKRPDRIRRKGKTFTRNIAADHNGFEDTCGKGWPIHSEALGVHPKQIQEAMAADRRDGVPTDYDRAGRPILRDAAHRRRFLRAKGFFDRSGFDSPRNC